MTSSHSEGLTQRRRTHSPVKVVGKIIFFFPRFLNGGAGAGASAGAGAGARARVVFGVCVWCLVLEREEVQKIFSLFFGG